ncbi:hypothetical protein SAMN05216266_10886 [Amycolatopsis marina]|uniref:Uncharacterized protein n=1 Tax=Amycolatopsis marina TaxID=490629 RepID=A0A1I1A588_9PSEU|nr:hypothetical protein [Amycolatopsis marina]SFB31660.1 hypothetical protein SAMN05216266_10886 [Amycolatopsis marina]
MDMSGRVERMRATLGALVREQSDRRELRDRQGQELKARSQEYMTKQVQAAERYVQHRRELGKRKEEAGGWATEKTLSDKSNVMGFGPEDPEEAPAAGFAQYTAPVPVAPAVPTPEPPPAAGGWQEPPSPPPAPAAPAPAVAEEPKAPKRPGRHARPQESFDDDDFSNNSWMK